MSKKARYDFKAADKPLLTETHLNHLQTAIAKNSYLIQRNRSSDSRNLRQRTLTQRKYNSKRVRLFLEAKNPAPQETYLPVKSTLMTGMTRKTSG